MKYQNVFSLETELKQLENSAQIFNALSDIPGDIDDVDQLLEVNGNRMNSTEKNFFIQTCLKYIQNFVTLKSIVTLSWIIN